MYQYPATLIETRFIRNGRDDFSIHTIFFMVHLDDGPIIYRFLRGLRFFEQPIESLRTCIDEKVIETLFCAVGSSGNLYSNDLMATKEYPDAVSGSPNASITSASQVGSTVTPAHPGTQ